MYYFKLNSLYGMFTNSSISKQCKTWMNYRSWTSITDFSLSMKVVIFYVSQSQVERVLTFENTIEFKFQTDQQCRILFVLCSHDFRVLLAFWVSHKMKRWVFTKQLALSCIRVIWSLNKNREMSKRKQMERKVYLSYRITQWNYVSTFWLTV